MPPIGTPRRRARRAPPRGWRRRTRFLRGTRRPEAPGPRRGLGPGGSGREVPRRQARPARPPQAIRREACPAPRSQTPPRTARSPGLADRCLRRGGCRGLSSRSCGSGGMSMRRAAQGPPAPPPGLGPQRASRGANPGNGSAAREGPRPGGPRRRPRRSGTERPRRGLRARAPRCPACPATAPVGPERPTGRRGSPSPRRE